MSGDGGAGVCRWVGGAGALGIYVVIWLSGYSSLCPGGLLLARSPHFFAVEYYLRCYHPRPRLWLWLWLAGWLAGWPDKQTWWMMYGCGGGGGGGGGGVLSASQPAHAQRPNAPRNFLIRFQNSVGRLRVLHAAGGCWCFEDRRARARAHEA
ncbi:uncharacterized protein J3D65DRAFT_46125 [Phyllosticta citribraziliensis]|uniref:Uncharacterized protein n=1 Tax=Phyllosticta citribraziliensis TaxID=989973 RepID=A0ABR1MDW1_9PEZI